MMIEGRNIYLRTLERSDLENVLSWINDASIAIPMGIDYPKSKKEQDIWYSRLLRDRAKKVFAIVSKKNNLHIGNLSIDQLDYRIRKARVSIFIGKKKFRKCGFGYDALITFLEYCFNHLNLHRIYLEVNCDNKVAIALYKKCGFKKEGMLRDDEFVNGKYINRFVMSILDYEFVRHAYEKQR